MVEVNKLVSVMRVDISSEKVLNSWLDVLRGHCRRDSQQGDTRGVRETYRERGLVEVDLSQLCVLPRYLVI